MRINEQFAENRKSEIKAYKPKYFIASEGSNSEPERTGRKRSFKEMLDKLKNVVADELLFTTTNDFFKDMSDEDIRTWANIGKVNN